eukprot:TRINITY_DN27153_c0_g1_i1.p1 TRINITY_DN27153_c0_g1~~TRINITY_DN27153_c0_g1_i1.p1  ORF type:complete len:366 (+),score=62.92 TRINITY_DN27153_c0_g1_i1:57-1100(+)
MEQATQASQVKPKETTTEEKIKQYFDVQGMQPPAGKERLTASDVDADSKGAESLARIGAWSEILKLTRGAGWRNVERCGNDEKVRRTHIHVMAMVKLGERRQTWEVLQQLDGCDIPFSLRLLKADLVADAPEPHGGDLKSQQQLYKLFHSLPEGEPGLTGSRRRAVVLKIVSSHNKLNQTGCALKAMADICEEYPTDIAIHHHYCCLLMQTGHIDAARGVYETICQLPPTSQKQATINTLKGLLAICNGKYDIAESCYTSNDCIDMNNKAVCAVYSEQLPDGVKIIESAIRANPESLTEATFQNLIQLYDMESKDASERKELLRAVATAYKGPDFVRLATPTAGDGK